MSSRKFHAHKKKHHCFTIAVGLLQRLIQARWPSYHYGRLQQGTSAIVSLSLLQSPTQICRLCFRQKHFVGGNRTSLVAGSNRMFQQIFCTVCTRCILVCEHQQISLYDWKHVKQLIVRVLCHLVFGVISAASCTLLSATSYFIGYVHNFTCRSLQFISSHYK